MTERWMLVAKFIPRLLELSAYSRRPSFTDFCAPPNGCWPASFTMEPTATRHTRQTRVFRFTVESLYLVSPGNINCTSQAHAKCSIIMP